MRYSQVVQYGVFVAFSMAVLTPAWACAPSTGCISEILYDPPPATGSNIPNQYFELRATPGTTFPSGTYLLSIEGDSSENPGTIDMVFDLTGSAVGANGYLVLTMAGHPFGPVLNPQAITIAGTTTGFGEAATFHSGNNEIELGSWTTLLIQAPAAPVVGADIDAVSSGGGHGIPDGGGYSSWTILDSIGMLGGGGGNDRTYAAFAFSKAGNGQNRTGTVAQTDLNEMQYVGRAGESTGDTVFDWVAGDVLGGTPPNYSLSPSTYPAAYAGQPLDSIGGPSFQNVPNDAPVNTVPGAQTTPEDTALGFSTAAGNAISAADPDADPNPAPAVDASSIRVTLDVLNGTLTLAATGGLAFVSGDGTADASMQFTGSLTNINLALDGVSYLPATDFNGADMLTITSDDQGAFGIGGPLSDTDTVSISVTAVNDIPLAAADGPFTTAEDTAVTTGNVLTNDDLGDVPTTITAFDATSANGGTVVNNGDGTFTYTPALNFNGSDTFTYTLTDPDLETSSTTVSITVTPVNDTPLAAADGPFTTAIDMAVTTGNVLTNDDFGDVPTTITAFDATSANGGTVVNNGDGTFTYTPALGFNGSDTFTYTLTDADLETSSATVSISVVANDTPVANNDAGSVAEGGTLNGTSVKANDTDTEDGTPPAGNVMLVTGPTNATSFTLDPDGTYVYVHDGSETTSVFFTYTVNDSLGATSNVARVDISITPVDDNDPVVTGGQTFSVAENAASGAVVGTVAATDADGDTLSYAFNPTSSTFAINATSGEITVIGALDFETASSYTLTVEVGDGSGALGSATITINVTDIDETAPTVVSVTRVGSSPTNASSVQFTVTFSENVTGVDASDFALQSTGTVAGASVTNVAGSGTTYTVAVGTGSGDGTLRLDVIDNDSIVDAGNTALAAGFTSGQAYTIDKTAPTVVSSVRVDANPPDSPAVVFRVTFSEAVTGVDLGDFTLTTTIPNAEILEVSGSGATYDVLVYTGNVVGTLRLDVLDDDSVIDAATNPLAGGFTAGEAYDVDPALFADIFYDGFEGNDN